MYACWHMAGFTEFRFFLLVILFELNMLYRRTVSILPCLLFWMVVNRFVLRLGKDLLLTEFEVRSVSYGPSFFFPFAYGPSAKRAGHRSTGKTRIRNLQYGPRKRD